MTKPSFDLRGPLADSTRYSCGEMYRPASIAAILALVILGLGAPSTARSVCNRDAPF
jgi:hypothetical protein